MPIANGGLLPLGGRREDNARFAGPKSRPAKSSSRLVGRTVFAPNRRPSRPRRRRAIIPSTIEDRWNGITGRAASAEPPSRTGLETFLRVWTASPNGIRVPRGGRESATKRETVHQQVYQNRRGSRQELFSGACTDKRRRRAKDAEIEPPGDAQVLFRNRSLPCRDGSLRFLPLLGARAFGDGSRDRFRRSPSSPMSSAARMMRPTPRRSARPCHAMRFVPLKSAKSQAALMLPKTPWSSSAR